MKPDFIADRAIFKPNNTNVTAYTDNMAPFNIFSETFF